MTLVPINSNVLPIKFSSFSMLICNFPLSLLFFKNNPSPLFKSATLKCHKCARRDGSIGTHPTKWPISSGTASSGSSPKKKKQMHSHQAITWYSAMAL